MAPCLIFPTFLSPRTWHSSLNLCLLARIRTQPRSLSLIPIGSRTGPYFPTKLFTAMASREAGSHLQDDVLRYSLERPDEFWAHQAEHLHWHRKPTATLRRTQRTFRDGGRRHESWEWFSGGEISTCYNCIDRHVAAGRGHHVAIYFDSPVTGTKETWTYRDLLGEVEVLAGALREEGVKKGDVVMIYSK